LGEKEFINSFILTNKGAERFEPDIFGCTRAIGKPFLAIVNAFNF